eukprot:CAMPEP_0117759806 /NCGR_PEP_ID=MMETSP0947-20121206/16227_1 /TAXON_ID=44440 /ORGANISM="Chattonella subsalsa, Strain CCMP2191" /LENGTH=1564 /DNA_ID=CAMNT_0005580323 /DNA_START=121 /DNA_END=4815 /DNA_ORIENTATION=+
MLSNFYRRSTNSLIKSLGSRSKGLLSQNFAFKQAPSRYGHNFRQIPGRIGLYDGQNEKDNCGVGLVAQLKKIQSRQIVEDANEMLVRMSHRGACGCEANTGDGAGMLVGMPDSFLRKVVKDELGFELPPQGQYGAGNIFLPKDNPEAVKTAKDIFTRIGKQRKLKVLGFRTVPTDNSDLGKSACDTEPWIEQIFVENTAKLSTQDFERELFRFRQLAKAEADNHADLQDFYVCSMSSQTLTYKGQLTPEQVMPYFKADLLSPDFQTHMALVHSRFSTNTFPSWDRAQPLRMMCHNGEINTLRGNKNWMHARSGIMHSPYYGDETYQLTPVCSDNMSDSGNFDATLETLVKGSTQRSLAESVMMMIPEAWQDNQFLSPTKKAFYEYNSCIMEPWDGPAMVAFTDGRFVGANLDRNGLRPSRYYVTKDDRVMISSEVGVIPELSDDLVVTKHRLEPGKMFLIDFDKAAIINDDTVKEEMASRFPYEEWLEKNLVELDDWVASASVDVPRMDFQTTNRRLNLFGFTTETLDLLLYPMGVGGKEALGSMGNDAPLAVLSQKPRQVFDYFKQLFAQVTNPPIDPIREEMVMSLMCPVGPEDNLLEVGEEHCKRLLLEHPILTLKQMQTIKETEYKDWDARTIDITFERGSGADGLREALDEICAEASAAIHGDLDGQGTKAIVLSDRLAGPERLPIPSLLAVGAVHQHLLKTQQRTKIALFAEVGDAREVHDFATLLGFGADGISPYVAYEALLKMNADGLIAAKCKTEIDDADLIKSYRKAAAKGILKVMSKMGISTLQSYKGAQVFEAVGLNDEVIGRCFTGTVSRIQGAGFEALYTDLERLHDAAYPMSASEPLVQNPGQFHYRHGGEAHLNTPHTMVNLQLAARGNSREAYKEFSRLIDEQNAKVTIRGLLKIKEDENGGIPLEEVEPAKEIVKRFATGAMSLGSISQETHESLAVAMNTLGGRSNTGEGGEDPKRFLDNRRSSIKQVASGRFGVTSAYLANSDQIQIKMAQGAKPGEGGELPGQKVTKYIGATRHTTPGVGLISPPPHHDIYSIEDLAQLIHDLKNAQPNGEVSVKLVSEVGVGVIAAGVSKAKADHIVISGHDGGTGAAAWTGVKGCGLPWELGVAEAQQTLVLNDLRSRVRLQTDGQIRNGRDCVIAALLGAEEMGFATGPLIALGCIMMRKCHLNTCPVGIATQDPELRKKFSGQPEHVINYFFLLAEEIREYMAKMGFRTFDEMVGRTDFLEVDKSKLHYKSHGLDLSPLLVSATSLNPDHTGVIKSQTQDHGIEDALDNELVVLASPALHEGQKVSMELPITNLNRTTGTMLSYNVTKKFGSEGLPEDSIHFKFSGHAGQSLGFALTKGIHLEIEGDSNDYVGKGLSGGKITVYPQSSAIELGFVPEDNVVVGNVCLYGATSGKAFFRGKAGERFCVRNSGALAVVEGVGDHGCEYMTGGRVVILGDTGRNFAAGMSGGIAYVYDPKGEFPEKCNMGLVGLEKVETEEEKATLKGYIQAHQDHTGSKVAASVLSNFKEEVQHFVKVFPHDYKRVLLEQAGGESDDEVAA